MTAALEYEHFLRNAFEHALDQNIGRGGDPAGLAEAGIYNTGDLPRLKSGTTYAIEIYHTELVNSGKLKSDSEHDRLDDFARRVDAATSVDDISVIIEDFTNTVLDRYYKAASGKRTLI